MEHAGDTVQNASGMFLALSLSLNLLAPGQAKVPPAVVDVSGQRRLVIPNEMQAAIDRIAPGFEPWRLADYLPRLLTGSNPNEVPFAVILDINNDQVSDLVVDGCGRTNCLVLAILSNQSGYTAKVVRSEARFDPRTIQDCEGGRVARGLHRFLQPNLQRSAEAPWVFTLYYAQVVNCQGQLLNDGAIVNYELINGEFVEHASPL